MDYLNDLSDELKSKVESLRNMIKSFGKVAVAFSSGVDSTFLLAVAHEELGDDVIAVTAVDDSVPERELNEASAFCKERGIRHILCKADPMQEEGYRNNSPDRCYYCKHTIFNEIKKAAGDNGIGILAEGSNMDDLGDYRPGMRAISELGVKSPLKDCGLGKKDIRDISRAMGLPTWSKPAYACLASRFVYGEQITREKLHMIDQAEQFLIEKGFYEERVRLHGNLARIEVSPADIGRLASDDIRQAVFAKFKEIGFSFVTLDMQGYRMGSMNETIK